MSKDHAVHVPLALP